MTRTYRFTQSIGSTECILSDGTAIRLPVFPGILKHPRPSELFALIQGEDAARKYTCVALEKAAWQVLKEFPRGWLIKCLEEVRLREGRRQALSYLLGLARSPFEPRAPDQSSNTPE